MKLTQSFAAKKFAEVAGRYQGQKEKIDAAVIKGIGFENAVNGSVTIDLTKAPKDFLKMLLDEYDEMTDNQRNKVAQAYHGFSLDVDTVLEGSSDVANMMSSLRATDVYNAELRLMGRWYPVRVVAHYHAPSRGNEAYTDIVVSCRIVDEDATYQWIIGTSFFKDDDGTERRMTGRELFEELGMRYIQQDVKAFMEKCGRADAMNRHSGKVKAVTNDVLVRDKQNSGYYWRRPAMVRTQLGSEQRPKKVVIESELEIADAKAHVSGEGKDATALPFVRVFSLDLKRYVYADVDDIASYYFDKSALDRLILPNDQKAIITKLFTADADELFGDVLQDKHGGMIILATGPTGTGKTLTAEVFAEITERLLYVMEMAELGIKVEEMEAKLATIFRRVTKWGAVLLMDECDVFLAQRGESLERAVIVGIFLRLMDYYKGLLFLTTNRPEVIDPAFKSRITIQLDYKALDRDVRREVWESMTDYAGIKVVGGLDGVPDMDLNGRQIRNMVRLTKVLHGGETTNAQIKEVCGFACK